MQKVWLWLMGTYLVPFKHTPVLNKLILCFIKQSCLFETTVLKNNFIFLFEGTESITKNRALKSRIKAFNLISFIFIEVSFKHDIATS